MKQRFGKFQISLKLEILEKETKPNVVRNNGVVQTEDYFRHLNF